ncbi:hypothetical protein ACNSOL_12360 (plasmid) [Aliarcobacter lanthieri]|uniref:hypothetical protein n=1 Tax=Aliarcobacter lanthieri TaxID=1355374 RepID=UPI003AAFE018
MQNKIIEIIKNELEEYKRNLIRFKGGMDEYKESLEDSDTFYNEASTLGSINALEYVLKKINSINIEKLSINIVYRPDFDKLPNNEDFEISNVWIYKEELELYLYQQGIDTSFIEEIKTDEFDCYPILIDSDEHEWDSKNKIFKLTLISSLKTLIEKNADLIVQTPKEVLCALFEDVELESSIMDTTGYLESYFFYFNSIKYFIQINNNKHITVMKPDDSGWDIILNITTENQYSIIENNGVKKLITVSQSILSEFWNEIISDIDYNSNDEGSGNGIIIIENDRYGHDINGYKIEYRWINAKYDYLTINNESYEICGASKLELAQIFSDKFFSKDELISSFIDYCRGFGISINQVNSNDIFINQGKYRLIYSGKYVAKIENRYFVADDNKGTNSKLLDYLPNGMEMNFLNNLCNTFNEQIKIFAFKNDISLFEEKRVIRLKEGEDDTEPVNYLISNLIADWQLKHAFKYASFIWNEIEDESKSFEYIEKKFQEEFQENLSDIVEKREKTSSWYDIFPSWHVVLQKIFEYLNIEFKIVEEKTFII